MQCCQHKKLLLEIQALVFVQRGTRQIVCCLLETGSATVQSAGHLANALADGPLRFIQ